MHLQLQVRVCAIGKHNQTAAQFVLDLFREGRARLLSTPGVVAPISVQSLRRTHSNNMPNMYVSADKLGSNDQSLYVTNTPSQLREGLFQLATVSTDRRGEHFCSHPHSLLHMNKQTFNPPPFQLQQKEFQASQMTSIVGNNTHGTHI